MARDGVFALEIGSGLDTGNTAAFSWAILRVVMALTGLCIDEADETRGLDVSVHAEEGYDL